MYISDLVRAGRGQAVKDPATAARILGIDDPRLAPSGPMASLVGPQLPPEPVAAAHEAIWEGETLAPVVLRSIRAFPVPSLVGQTVTCPPSEFVGHLRQLVINTLPGTTWPEWPPLPWGQPGTRGLVEKHHRLEGSYPAPIDETTGQSMVLELAGYVGNVGGPLFAPSGSGSLLAPFTPVVKVTITHAHWANVAHLGIGVGYYE
jgi:hypothetical protein